MFLDEASQTMANFYLHAVMLAHNINEIWEIGRRLEIIIGRKKKDYANERTTVVSSKALLTRKAGRYSTRSLGRPSLKRPPKFPLVASVILPWTKLTRTANVEGGLGWHRRTAKRHIVHSPTQPISDESPRPSNTTLRRLSTA